jgi:hypothetical protein
VTENAPDPAEDRLANWPSEESLAEVRTIAPPHPAVLSPEKLASQCRMTQLRRSGPGGQHRNKVSTAINWQHEPSGISAEASESRDQTRNRREALARLRLRLAIRLRTSREANGAVIADAAERQCRAAWTGKNLKVSNRNDDFSAVLALVLDDLYRAGGQPSLVGPLWNATTTAVVALVATEPAALQEVNRWREHHHRRPLRR